MACFPQIDKCECNNLSGEIIPFIAVGFLARNAGLEVVCRCLPLNRCKANLGFWGNYCGRRF